MWTEFYDMSSGGSRKLKHRIIYIEANTKLAIFGFKCIFDIDPEKTTCKCCGENYSIHSGENREDLCYYEDPPFYRDNVRIISKEELFKAIQ